MSLSVVDIKEHLTLFHDWFVFIEDVIKYKEHPWSKNGPKLDENLKGLKTIILKLDEKLFEPYSYEWAEDIPGCKKMASGVLHFFNKNNKETNIQCLDKTVQLGINNRYIDVRTLAKTRLDFLNLLKMIGFEKDET